MCFDGKCALIESSRFLRSIARQMGGVVCQGLAMPSSLIVRDCIVRECTAGSYGDIYGGGAIYTSTGSTSIMNCVFGGCSSDGHGGTIVLTDFEHESTTGNSEIINCVIMNSWTDSSGGGICYDASQCTLTIWGLTCINCSCKEDGNAISILACSGFRWGELCIQDCGDDPVNTAMNKPEIWQVTEMCGLNQSDHTGIYRYHYYDRGRTAAISSVQVLIYIFTLTLR